MQLECKTQRIFFSYHIELPSISFQFICNEIHVNAVKYYPKLTKRQHFVNTHVMSGSSIRVFGRLFGNFKRIRL